MPNDDVRYILTNGANSSSVGASLNGCKIEQTGAQAPYTYYFLTQTRTSFGPLTGPLPITFQDVSITQGPNTTTWDITVDTLPSTTDAGNWVTPSQHAMRPEDVPPTNGEFTAQVGGTFEEAAASAGHGKQ